MGGEDLKKRVWGFFIKDIVYLLQRLLSLKKQKCYKVHDTLYNLLFTLSVMNFCFLSFVFSSFKSHVICGVKTKDKVF